MYTRFLVYAQAAAGSILLDLEIRCLNSSLYVLFELIVLKKFSREPEILPFRGVFECVFTCDTWASMQNQGGFL